MTLFLDLWNLTVGWVGSFCHFRVVRRRRFEIKARWPSSKYSSNFLYYNVSCRNPEAPLKFVYHINSVYIQPKASVSALLSATFSIYKRKFVRAIVWITRPEDMGGGEVVVLRAAGIQIGFSNSWFWWVGFTPRTFCLRDLMVEKREIVCFLPGIESRSSVHPSCSMV